MYLSIIVRENTSPEEKLLHLIKGQRKPQEAKPESKSLPSVDVSSQQPKKIKKSLSGLKIQKNLSFLNIQRIIWTFFALSCAYLIISFVYPLIGPKKIELPKVATTTTSEKEIEPPQESKPYEFYLQAIKERQIFSSAPGKETEGTASIINSDLIKDINLVGIISGASPQAVIEDKKLQKTYYVNKGQFIGEFQVEDIQEAKIILSYKGQKFELYL